MLEKLEHEHKERLEKQQKQYEEYMRTLEENMKQRFDEYLSLCTGLVLISLKLIYYLLIFSIQESKSELSNESMNLRHVHSSMPKDSSARICRSHSNTYQYRPLAEHLVDHNTNENSTIHTTLIPDKQQTMGRNLSRSQSREDISK